MTPSPASISPGRPPGRRPSPVALVLLLLLTAYRRVVSPLLGARCRFAPSCSAYATQAVRDHGAIRGSYLAARRLLRCHPFHPGGFDPVPPPRPSRRAVRRPRSTGANAC